MQLLLTFSGSWSSRHIHSDGLNTATAGGETDGHSVSILRYSVGWGAKVNSNHCIKDGVKY